MKNAQIAVEFMLMLSMAMIVVMALLGVVYYLFTSYSEDKNMRKLQDLGYSLQSEIILASQVEPVYERTIFIPDKIGTSIFSITNTEADIVITYKGTDLLFPIPNVTGNLSTGYNIITKTDANIITIT